MKTKTRTARTAVKTNTNTETSTTIPGAGKIAKFADVEDGAEMLGRLLDAMYGPDWRPTGNGTFGVSETK